MWWGGAFTHTHHTTPHHTTKQTTKRLASVSPIMVMTKGLVRAVLRSNMCRVAGRWITSCWCIYRVGVCVCVVCVGVGGWITSCWVWCVWGGVTSCWFIGLVCVWCVFGVWVVNHELLGLSGLGGVFGVGVGG